MAWKEKKYPDIGLETQQRYCGGFEERIAQCYCKKNEENIHGCMIKDGIKSRRKGIKTRKAK